MRLEWGPRTPPPPGHSRGWGVGGRSGPGWAKGCGVGKRSRGPPDRHFPSASPGSARVGTWRPEAPGSIRAPAGGTLRPGCGRRPRLRRDAPRAGPARSSALRGPSAGRGGCGGEQAGRHRQGHRAGAALAGDASCAAQTRTPPGDPRPSCRGAGPARPPITAPAPAPQPSPRPSWERAGGSG